MRKLILIDGNSIAYRAFYALPLLTNSGGLHTNAAYGFTTMLLKLIEEEQPTHFLAAFDAGKITFRHEEYKEYKGGREKTPPELSEQFPLIKELLQAFCIRQYEQEGYEADDIIGTLSRRAEEEQFAVLVVTGDKDMLQLVSDRVTVALTRKGISEVERFGPQEIAGKYGLKPQQIIDLKGLMGDASDNIPGVPGVGEKTALKLLHEYGTVENVLAHADELKGKMREKMREYADQARLSKELATIYREVPVEIAWDELKFSGFDNKSVKKVLQKLEFKSILERLDLQPDQAGDSAAEKLDVQVIEDKSGVDRLAARLDRIRSVHFEVIGENPHQADVLGAAFVDGEQCFYLPFAVLQSSEAQAIRSWLADEGKEKWLYDVHGAEIALHWAGIGLEGAAFDVLLAGYLLDPTESNHTISGLSAKYGLSPVPPDEEVYGKGAKFRVPELPVLSAHICRKAAAVERLVPLLKRDLAEAGMNGLFYDLEMPVSRVLAKMEKQGVRVDVDGLKAYGAELREQLERIVGEIYELAGMEFNLNSPKQLGYVLFEKLNLPVIKKTKTGYSTDAEVLEKLEPYHVVVSKLLHYRQLSKLESTYVEGLLKEVRPETGKVHTYFKQTVAATGRLSSQFPNLQNIPIRLEEGRKIRKVFVPSEPGWYILSADYSQIELRILAHISGDEKLKEAFANNLDIHTKTAMDVFHVQEVDSNMRRQAKAVNFGIVYGISDYGLSQNLNITRKEAAQFIDKYFAVYKGVKRYMEEIVQQARKTGYVSTLLNRRRYLPEINSSNYNLRSFAERTAINTPIQGTAADIIKKAMVQLAARMEREKVKSRMLLQVHDELVFEVPEDELELMQRMVPEVMEHAITLDVPVKVDVCCGMNWYEAK